jgi:aryl-alcohol dehydrogenase-like predicted oxidoreductase
MAAKNKKISRATSRPVTRKDSDLQDLLGLHFQASRRVEEVLEQVEELKSAGKIAEARVMLMHAQGIQQGLRALEAEVRMPTRAPRTHVPDRKTIT